MKRLLYIVMFVLVLAITGFVAVSFLQGTSRSQLSAKYDSATPVALPTTLVGFPDIEHVPVYPNASVTFTDTEEMLSGLKIRDISYEVEDSMDKVGEFYQEMLPKMGWQLRLKFSGRSKRYIWTNPAEKPLWHMHLDVGMDLSLDDTKTLVYLEYGRYPNTEEGLPLYPDAQQVAITRSNTEKDIILGGKTRVHVTDVTYLSSATTQEIADFYINSMQEYGWSVREPGWSTHEYAWFPFDGTGSWDLDNQPGDNSSHEGLYFVARRPSWERVGSTVAYHLLATATVQEDGRAVIKLHIEELEPSGDF